VLAAVLVPILVLTRPRRRVLVGVSAEGITLLGRPGARGTGARQRRIAWAAIWRVVVVDDVGGGRVVVGVRLRPGAPLPPGARVVIDDPSGAGPLQPDLCQALDAARIDRAALAAAVRALAPPGVELVGEPLAALGGQA